MRVMDIVGAVVGFVKASHSDPLSDAVNEFFDQFAKQEFPGKDFPENDFRIIQGKLIEQSLRSNASQDMSWKDFATRLSNAIENVQTHAAQLGRTNDFDNYMRLQRSLKTIQKNAEDDQNSQPVDLKSVGLSVTPFMLYGAISSAKGLSEVRRSLVMVSSHMKARRANP